MKSFSIKYCLFSFFTIFAILSAHSQNVKIDAKLDSVNVLMGKITTLTINVDMPKGKAGHFPIFANPPQNGFIGVCGDSVELRLPSKIDTIENGNVVSLKYHIPVQAFDSGTYVIPALPFVVDKDTFLSNPVNLAIFPVKVSANEPIDDYAGLAEPQKYSAIDPVIDHMPASIADIILDYWWAVIIIVLAIGASIYALLKYKRQGFIIPAKPTPTPYEAAISAMRELKNQKLWEQGLEKEYFTRLTDILRVYLFRRFGINAMEMTSRQIMQSLSANEDIKDKRHYFRQILDMADFVKFAKVRPLPDDNIASYDNALRFINETRPVESSSPDAVQKDTNVNSNAKAINKSDRKGGEL